MTTINQTDYSLYYKNTYTTNSTSSTASSKTESTNTEVQKTGHHHRKNSVDSVELSDNAIFSMNSSDSDTKKDDPLESLVEAGTITSDQAKSIQNALNSNSQVNSYKKSGASDPIQSLVSSGTITSDQAKSIKNVIFAGRMEESKNTTKSDVSDQENGIETTLSGLVASGTISKSQMTSIISAMDPSGKTSTDANSTNSQTDPIEELVTNGTLTEDQANEVKETLEKNRPQGMPPMPPQGVSADDSLESNKAASSTSNTLDDTLEELVTNGTLTEDQLKEVEESLEKNKPQGMPPMPPQGVSADDSTDSSTISSTLDNSRNSMSLESLLAMRGIYD